MAYFREAVKAKTPTCFAIQAATRIHRNRLEVIVRTQLLTSSHNNSPQAATYGFITVVELNGIGHCGGLLIVSQIGRPIEFHCTAPVTSNRAQEIMYGKTYNGFLVADQIGMALVDKAKNQPTMFVTDCVDMLPITELIDAPLIFAQPSEEKEPFDGQGLTTFQINEQSVYCINASSGHVDALRTSLQAFTKMLPIDEPFERICRAIEEAHTGLRAA